MEGITTMQIYWGAVPFVVIQVIMVGLTIGFPQMVMHYRSGLKEFDLDTIRIELPPMGGVGAPGAPGGVLNLPGSGLSLDGPPVFGTPPPGATPAQPAEGQPSGAEEPAPRPGAGTLPSGGLGLPPPNFGAPPDNP